MKPLLLTLIVSITFLLNISGQAYNSKGNCNEIRFLPKSSKPDFANYIKGVKNVVITWDAKVLRYLPIQNALYSYLKKLGFENIIAKKDWTDYIDLLGNNLCETVYVNIDFEYAETTNQSNTIHYDEDYIDNISISFLSCNGDFWSYSSNQKVNARRGDNLEIGIYNAFVDAYNRTKGDFNSYYTLKQDAYQTCWTESILKASYLKNLNSEIEGIYEATSKIGNRYRLAAKLIDDKIYLLYLGGAGVNKDNWKEGEIKAELEPTSTSFLYKAKWYNADKSVDDDDYISFESGLFTLLSQDGKDTYIKMFPSFKDSKNNIASASGTGFAISSKGYIVTNYHVTQSSNKIKIRGINGDFSKSYNARVVLEDKNNDLSIIKIEDSRFNSLGEIPFTIANRASDVGTSIFVLGYPLLNAMGDEIKLTNGIISSKSGYKGDVTTYQISAPIQPGNSGGPLFDNKGNLIGIVNAKLKGAENASYAIKSLYLLNLIDIIPNLPNLQTQNFISDKNLVEQVKILKKFIYIIEVN